MDTREMDARMDDSQMTLCSGCEQKGECENQIGRDTNPVTPTEEQASIDPIPEAIAAEAGMIKQLSDELLTDEEQEEFEEELAEKDMLLQVHEDGRLEEHPEEVVEPIITGELHEESSSESKVEDRDSLTKWIES